MVAGGALRGNGETDTVEIYDPSTNSWEMVLEPMIDAVEGLRLVSDGRGLIHAVGGYNSRLRYLDDVWTFSEIDYRWRDELIYRLSEGKRDLVAEAVPSENLPSC